MYYKLMFLFTAIMSLVIGLSASGCNNQDANQAANTAAQKVSNAASNVASKAEEVTANVNKAAGPAVADATITARVKAKLLADGITGTTIDTTDGVVTLTGSVAAADQRDKAERHARETDGVKSVRNELVVRSK